ncbi:MAG: SusC/RagA family TonB-linked outer membrane protein, partial [Chitinophagaceae bacterium]
MRQKMLFVLSLMMLVVGSAFSQTKVVRGTVTDSATNNPLPGVSVTIPGNSSGTATNDEGKFSLTVPSTTRTITLSLVDYGSVVADVTGNDELQIKMRSGNRSMDEVVVIGYGTQKKKDLTGAVSTIGSRDVAGRQTIQVSEALQGAVSGVSVTRTSGAPGSTGSILIRGITTLGTNSPLIILDGVPVSNIDNVNPNDVESITVLKDAASAAIYGSRGAAGVILISTKRAKDGQSSFEYNFEYGWQKPTALPEYASAPEYMRYFNEQQTNDGATTGSYPQAFIDNFADSNRLNPDKFPFGNTNWQKTIMTKDYAPRVRHDLVFTMGTGKVKTKASVGYSSADAFYVNNSYERYLVRVNNDLQINNKLSANFDIAYKRTEIETPVVNPIREARVMPSIYDDFYNDGRYALAKDGRNPIAELNEGGTVKSAFNQIQGRLVFRYKPIKDLVLTALFSPTFDFDQTKSFSKRLTFTNPDGSASSFSNRPRTILNEIRNENLVLTGQFFADYNKQFNGGHSLGILGGYEEIYNKFDSLTASRSGFALNDFPYLNS